MKIIRVLFIPLLVFALYFGVVNINTFSVQADSDDYYKHHSRDDEGHENEAYEDIGKFVGWGTVVVLGIAGAIFPIRRYTKSVIAKYPKLKKFYVATAKFIGRYHLFIGLLALILGISHGIMMYLSEGELESEGVIGIGSILLMIVASFAGFFLFKNKRIKSVRITHMTLIGITLFTVFLHIFIS